MTYLGVLPAELDVAPGLQGNLKLLAGHNHLGSPHIFVWWLCIVKRLAHSG